MELATDSARLTIGNGGKKRRSETTNRRDPLGKTPAAGFAKWVITRFTSCAQRDDAEFIIRIEADRFGKRRHSRVVDIYSAVNGGPKALAVDPVDFVRWEKRRRGSCAKQGVPHAQHTKAMAFLALFVSRSATKEDDIARIDGICRDHEIALSVSHHGVAKIFKENVAQTSRVVEWSEELGQAPKDRDFAEPPAGKNASCVGFKHLADLRGIGPVVLAWSRHDEPRRNDRPLTTCPR